MNNNKTNNNASDELLLQEHREGGILRLTLNDMKRRNALSEEMLAALGDALLQARGVRVVTDTATGRQREHDRPHEGVNG